MNCIKTYEYHLSEDEIRQIIADSFNRQQTKHLPITKTNVQIKQECEPYCEPKTVVVITIEEGAD
jgi:hypothetical protein